MIYNILLASKKISEIEALKSILEKNLTTNKDVTFEIECVKDIEEKYGLLEQNYYHMVVADFSLLAKHTFKIFTFHASAIIYSLKENTTQDDVFEETVLRGAYPILYKLFEHQKIASFLLSKIEESKFQESYSNRLIQSMIQLEGTEDVANMMVSYGRTVCKQYDIVGLNRSDILRVLAIFSISIKNKSLLKTIRFFERMRIANELLDLLHGSIEPFQTEGHILHTIYQHTKMEITGLPHDQCCSVSIPEEIHTNIVDIIKKHKVFIEKGLDLDHIWIRLIDALNKTETPQGSYDAFLNASIKLSRYIICYTCGGVVTMDSTESTLIFKIETIETIDEENIVKIFCAQCLHDNNVKIDIFDKEAVITLNTNIIQKSKLAMESKNNYVLHQENRIFITASEYIDNIEDIESIKDTVETLEDYENIAERAIAETKDISKETLNTVADTILKYSQFLSVQNEFKELAYVLTTLASILKNADERNLEGDKNTIYIILTSIIDDLRGWKNNIFITKIAKDIHYLDDSLYSSCLQLEKILAGETEESVDEDEDDDLELF